MPKGRVSRFLSLGTAVTKMAAGGLKEKARRVGKSVDQTLPHVLLTRNNAIILAKKLSRLRGAAMKVGQMLSLEGDNMLPSEFAEALSILRSSAHQMPEGQVVSVLSTELGPNFRDRFAALSLTPMAAASIGQVHAATHHDGRRLALKIQYPGVAESVDSDVDNLRSFLSLARLLPGEVDVETLSRTLKEELHREVDYRRELSDLVSYREALGSLPEVYVPEPVESLSTSRVLCLEFAPGQELLTWAKTAPQEKRDRAAQTLIQLLLREWFQMGLCQTDPNPANYLYDEERERLVLLDFGATHEVPTAVKDTYRTALRGLALGDRELLREVIATLEIDLSGGPVGERLIDVALLSADIFADAPYDFATSSLAESLKVEGRKLVLHRKELKAPPPEYLFFQRKLAGTFLLCRQLRARVSVRQILVEAGVLGPDDAPLATNG